MRSLWIAAALSSLSLPAVASEEAVGRFPHGSGEPPAPWQLLRFDDKIPATHYALREWEGVAAIEAKAEASMALLARPVSIDLARTPVLCWRWRVDGALKTADMRSKAGDDYAARVYVSFTLKPEALGWATRAKLALGRSLYGPHVPDAAVNYVWDNRQRVGTRLPNAYTDRTRMLVLRSGDVEASHWVSERRDVLADAEREFGPNIQTLSQLALASDTDNTGEAAHAGFAALHFVARDAPCQF